MYLNFSYDQSTKFCNKNPRWCARCRNDLDNCVGRDALHEFGHAVGLRHEQARVDVSQRCRDLEMSQGRVVGDLPEANGIFYVGEYDKYSVMNYCQVWDLAQGLQLSDTDIQGINVLYPELGETNKPFDNSGFYKIVSRLTGHCMHLEAPESARGQARLPMSQWPCGNGPEFKFHFERTVHGNYRIWTKYKTCFHVQNGPTTALRKPLITWQCLDQPEFLFDIQHTTDGYIRLRSIAGTCIHVQKGPTTAKRSKAWTWNCINRPEFFFKLVR